MPGIELSDVAAPEFLHQPADIAGSGWGHQQMHMVVHQHVCVQAACGLLQHAPQQSQIAAPVMVVEKAGQPVVAALDHMLRNAWKVESGKPDYAVSWPLILPPRYRPTLFRPSD